MTSKENAFSLIELLITLSIVIIILRLSIPQLLTSHDQAITKEIDKISMIIFYLRQKALACNQEYELFFNAQTNSYFYEGADTKRIQHTLAQGVQLGFLPGAKGPPSKPLELIEQSLSFPYNPKTKLYKITFTPYGSITPGTMYLINNHNKMHALTSSPSALSYLRNYHYEKNGWNIFHNE